MLYIISCITVQHDLWLVLLAGVICAFGCWVTSRLSKHSQNRTGSRSTPWALLSAVIAGVTIWCTHFIAMLGYQPAVPVSFDLMLTALSLFIAVVGSIVGILFANAVKLKAAPVIGGAILGLTISAMHYTGMIAYRVTGLVFWNEGYLITSIVLAIVLSAAALHLGHQKIRGSEIYMTVALTLAIVCLHFIGMVAFNVSVLDISSEHVNPEAFQTLALAVAGTAVIIVICGFLSYVVENRANLESIAELSAARNAAENASRAKSEFMSVLSHELRTPLTIVLGYASMLSALREVQIKQSGGSGDGSEQTATSEQMIDQAEQFGEKIKVAANHLLTLINEILDYTSLEANDTKLAPTSFPVRDLLHQVVDQFEDLAVKKSTRIYFENDDIIAFADRGRCLQVLINLVGNALKFSGSTEIALRARMTETGFSFEVEDNGCGIPEEDLERIFEAFLQLESAGHRSEGGTGLGLAISKKLADAQGGNITVQSILGTGTKFTFNLPMDAVGSTIAPSQNAELAGGKSAPSLESIKIG